ncbi:MAG: TPM domain-containing protein [Limnobacter sp.]|nr:TPM domain-containing protein [Limnobacter sp.]
MNFKRMFKHLLMMQGHVNKAFPKSALDRIESTIQQCESKHEGEICFVVEASLDLQELLANVSSRQKALAVFSDHRVWDTEKNCGVLVYVLLADRHVEIVADRGVNAKSGPHAWAEICNEMIAEFAKARFEEGAVKGILAIAQQLESHFPAPVGQGNELPDRPVLM